METPAIATETQLRMDTGEIQNFLFLDDAFEVLVKEAKPDESLLRQDVTKISFGCFGGRVVLYSDGTWRFGKSS